MKLYDHHAAIDIRIEPEAESLPLGIEQVERVGIDRLNPPAVEGEEERATELSPIEHRDAADL